MGNGERRDLLHMKRLRNQGVSRGGNASLKDVTKSLQDTRFRAFPLGNACVPPGGRFLVSHRTPLARAVFPRTSVQAWLVQPWPSLYEFTFSVRFDHAGWRRRCAGMGGFAKNFTSGTVLTGNINIPRGEKAVGAKA